METRRSDGIDSEVRGKCTHSGGVVLRKAQWVSLLVLPVCCSQQAVDRGWISHIPRRSGTLGCGAVLRPMSRKVPEREINRAGNCCDYFPRVTIFNMTLQNLIKMADRILIC